MYKVQTWLMVVVMMSLLPATGAFAAQEAHQSRMVTQVFEKQPVASQPANEIEIPQAIEDTPTPVPTVDPEKHPVILAMAAYFGVPPQEIRDLFDSGVGLGVIARAYVLGPLLGKTPQEIIDMKKSGDTNWGQLKKGVKGTPGADVSLGDIMSGKSTPEPTASVEAVSAQVRDRDKDKEQVHKQEQESGKEPNSEANQELKGSGGESGSHGDGSGNGNGGGGSDKGHGGSNGGGGKGK